MRSGGGGTTTTVQNSDPWKGQQPFLKDIYSQASGLYGGGAGYNPYPGQVIAGLTPMQEQGINAAYKNIVGGNTPTANATGMLNATLKGRGGNPYLDDVFRSAAAEVTDQFNRNILPGIKSGYLSGGMFDSSRRGIAEGVAAGEAQKNLTGLAANIYAPAYEAERGRQMQAAQLAPGLSNYDAQQLISLGGIDQQQLQRELDAMQNYWNAYQGAPWSRLGSYTQNVMGYGSPGGTTTGSTDTNKGGVSGLGLLGGGAMGAGMAGMLPTAFMAANPYMWPVLIGGGALMGSGLI